MRITIGEKIKELRQKRGCTQEELAKVMGITGQAVSRWESGTTYPDLELIPSLANYFQISIDQLFGYDSDRQKRIEEILSSVAKMKQADKPDYEGITVLLRNACAEFPGDEKLSFELANSLSKLGSQNAIICYMDTQDGYTYFDTLQDRDNAALKESILLFRRLSSEAEDDKIVHLSRKNLAYLYFRTGDFDKAIQTAENFPEMCNCRELLLMASSTGKKHLEYSQKALLELLRHLQETLLNILFSRHLAGTRAYPQTDSAAFCQYQKMWNEKYNGLIRLYELIFDDGNMGQTHLEAMKLYLSMVHNYHQILIEEKDHNQEQYLDAIFDCLDNALVHAKRYDALPDTYTYTAPLADHVTVCGKTSISAAQKLSESWIFDPNGGLQQILEKDPRWKKWLEKVQKG